MGDMLFNMVPGSRTKPAVVKPQCRCLSCAAIGLIFMGLVPYIQRLLALQQLNTDCFICKRKYFCCCSFVFLYIFNFSPATQPSSAVVFFLPALCLPLTVMVSTSVVKSNPVPFTTTATVHLTVSQVIRPNKANSVLSVGYICKLSTSLCRALIHLACS